MRAPSDRRNKSEKRGVLARREQSLSTRPRGLRAGIRHVVSGCENRKLFWVHGICSQAQNEYSDDCIDICADETAGCSDGGRQHVTHCVTHPTSVFSQTLPAVGCDHKSAFNHHPSAHITHYLLWNSPGRRIPQSLHFQGHIDCPPHLDGKDKASNSPRTILGQEETRRRRKICLFTAWTGQSWEYMLHELSSSGCE